MKYNAVISADKEDSGDEPVTLEEVKAYSRIDGDDEDELLEDLITSCRLDIEKYCNISLVAGTVTATVLNQLGGIELPYGPVTEMTSITDVDDNEILPADYKTGGGLFKYIKTEFETEVVCVYESGYETLPGNLKTALLAQIDFVYNNRSEAKLSPDVRTMLNPIRRI